MVPLLFTVIPRWQLKPSPQMPGSRLTGGKAATPDKATARGCPPCWRPGPWGAGWAVFHGRLAGGQDLGRWRARMPVTQREGRKEGQKGKEDHTSTVGK